MKKTALFISALLMVSVAAAQPSNPGGNPFNSLFSGVDNFVESLEVRMAGAIGGPDLKSKALANNANESLREAKKLSDQNRSEEAAERIEKYNRQMNRSMEAAGQANSSRLDSKLSNVSRKNVETLEKVRDKVPEQAKQGIQKAIDNAEKARGKPVRENPGRVGGDAENPSSSGKSNVSEKLDKGPGTPDVGKKVNETVNRTVEKGREAVNRTTGVPENVSRNGSETVERAAENVSDGVNDSSITGSKPRDNSSGAQDEDGNTVEKESDAAEDVVDETAGKGSGNGGGVGLP